MIVIRRIANGGSKNGQGLLRASLPFLLFVFASHASAQEHARVEVRDLCSQSEDLVSMLLDIGASETPSPARLSQLSRSLHFPFAPLRFLERRTEQEMDSAILALGPSNRLICARRQDESRAIALVAERLAEMQVHASNEQHWTVNSEVYIDVSRAMLVVVAPSGVRIHPFTSELELDERPTAIQLLAEGAEGMRPLFLWRDPHAAAARIAMHGQNARELFFSLRNQSGTAPLRNNRLLRQAAEEQAGENCQGSRATHRDANGEGPVERARNMGISARALYEVVGVGASESAAFEEMMQSPSHLAALLAPATDFGIGIAENLESSRTCVVFLLASWPRYVGRHSSGRSAP